MPRRELLTSSERDQLLALPRDDGALLRVATLSREDLAFIGQHRGNHNRLGVGIQLCYLRHLGRVLGTDEAPDAQLLDLVAAQLKVPAAVWDLYANRDQTRREHLQEILERLSLKQFDRVTHREIAKWLLATALQTTQGFVLAQAVVEELRRRCVVLPPVLVIERICSEVATRAQRHVHRALTESLTDEQRKKLDRLLESGDDGSHSLLAWLRLPPGAASARNILSHIERLLEIRSIGISVETGRKVHQNRLLRLAREGAQTAVFQLQQYEIERRHATLVAILGRTQEREIYAC
jgi:TnpA family transposase